MLINKKNPSLLSSITITPTNHIFDGKSQLFSTSPWLQNLSFISLCVYLYSWYLFDDLGSLSSSIFVLLGIYFYIKNYSVLKEPLTYLFLAAALIQIISWYLSTQYHADWSSGSPKIHRLGTWFKIIPIAILLGGRSDKVIFCGLISTIALFSAPFILGNGWNDIRTGLSGHRVDFGINNAQHTALISGAILLALFAAITVNFQSTKLKQLIIYTILATLLLGVSGIVIFTQTRGVWLGLFIALPILFIVYWINNERKLLTAIIGILFFLIITASFQDVIEKRVGNLTSLLKSREDITKLLAKDESISIRLFIWEDSLKFISQRPYFGWGGSAEKHIVENAMSELNTPMATKHLHNSYLSVLLKYGFIGLLFVISLYSLLSVYAYRSWKAKIMPTPVFIFLSGFIVFWLFVNLFESYFFYSTGEYVFSLIGGIVLSYYWKFRKQKTNQD